MDTTLTHEDVKWALDLIELARKEKNEKLLARFTAPPDATFAPDVPRQFWIHLLKQRYFDGLIPAQLIDRLGDKDAVVYLISFAHSKNTPVTESKQQMLNKRKRSSADDTNNEGHIRNKPSRSNKKKKHEQFVAEVEALRPQEYEVLDKYVDAKTRIRFRHIRCGLIFWQAPDKHLRGHGCQPCRTKMRDDKQRKTHEQFVNEVESLHPGEYQILGKYDGTHTPILIRHLICDTIFSQEPNSHLQGHGCQVCAYVNQRKTHEEFEAEVKALHSGEYELLSKYVDYKTAVQFRHMPCGSIYPQLPVYHLRGSGCWKCSVQERADKQRKTPEQFLKEVETIHPGEYEVLGKYYQANSPIQFRHIKCGSIFPQSPSNHIRGAGCPNCKYKSEQCAREIAERLIGDKFPKMHPPWLKGLEGDCYNERRKRMIEYNGRQHVEYNVHFHRGNEANFKAQQERDARKRQLCKEHGVELLEIPHTFTYREPEKMEAFIRKWFEDLGDIPRQQTTLNFASSDSS